MLMLAIILGGVLLMSFPLQTTLAQSRDPSFAAFTDTFDSFNTVLWHKADGWTNGDPFDCWLESSVFGIVNCISIMHQISLAVTHVIKHH